MRRLLFIGLLFASTLTATAQEPVRFLQFTDAHLFDDGEKEPKSGCPTIAKRWMG